MSTKVPGGKPHPKEDSMLGAEFGIGSNGEPSPRAPMQGDSAAAPEVAPDSDLPRQHYSEPAKGALPRTGPLSGI